MVKYNCLYKNFTTTNSYNCLLFNEVFFRIVIFPLVGEYDTLVPRVTFFLESLLNCFVDIEVDNVLVGYQYDSVGIVLKHQLVGWKMQNFLFFLFKRLGSSAQYLKYIKYDRKTQEVRLLLDIFVQNLYEYELNSVRVQGELCIPGVKTFEHSKGIVRMLKNLYKID